jgi:hypothetical protein
VSDAALPASHGADAGTRRPPINQAVLKAVTLHLAKVASYSDKNKMVRGPGRALACCR